MPGKKRPVNEFTKAIDEIKDGEKRLEALALKANNEKATKQDKEAHDHFKKALDEKKAAMPRLRMKYTGATRVNKALAAIAAVKALGNKRQYGITQADVERITDALRSAVDNTYSVLNNALTATAPTKETGAFSFD